MAEKYDPVLDLGNLVVAGLTYRNYAYHWASRIAERLGLGEDDYAETVAGELRKALGVPGPRTVTYDMAAFVPYLVLTAALEEFAAAQRDRARHEGGNPRRHEWADLADEMRKQAKAAREARDGK